MAGVEDRLAMIAHRNLRLDVTGAVRPEVPGLTTVEDHIARMDALGEREGRDYLYGLRDIQIIAIERELREPEVISARRERGLAT